MNTPALEELRAFRHQVYTMFGCRRDALFELLEAVLTAPSIETPAHLSLVPACQRGWGSLYDALNAGTMNLHQLETLIAAYPPASETAWYAVDASVWPRCDAETSRERGYYHHSSRHSHGQPIVGGWNYSWLVQVPSRCSSWTAPLRVRRLLPGENVNAVAAEQLRSWQRQAPPATAAAPLPIFSFDAGYDAVQLDGALHDLPICLLVRLRAGRCFYTDPTAQPTTGRPRRHGAKFVCADPTTWPEPTDRFSCDDPQYGHVQVQAWSGLHPIPQQHARRDTRGPRPLVRGTLIRLEVAHLPRPTKTPEPLWFWWAGPCPPDLAALWQAHSPASPLSTPSASSSKRSNGPHPNCVPQRRPTAGPGCCSWRTSSCAWHATTSPMSGCPGSPPCRPNVAPQHESVAALRTSWGTWAVPSTCQNPVDGRAGVPKASVRHQPHAFRPSN